MKLKKLFLIIGIIFTLCIAFGITANAETEGIYTYSVSNGEATITGCDSSVRGDITIPSSLGGYPVTSIVDATFSDGGVFAEFNRLESVTLPDGITRIGNRAFSGCRNLASINLPNSLTSIGECAFYGCWNLTSITIPNSWTSIGEWAFAGSGLESITIPNGVESIGAYAFADANLKNVIIPNSIISIGDGAFGNCNNITSIIIPDSVTSVGVAAFGGCDNIASIVIPDNVTSIEKMTFNECGNLTSITIPKSVTFIDSDAFHGCVNLKDIYYYGTKADWAEIEISTGNLDLTYAKIHYGDENWDKEPKTAIQLSLGQKEVIINGQSIENDVAPKAVNNRTMLPIRVIAEALGAKVEWFGETSTVRITADGVEISLVIGDSFAMVNNEKVELDSPSFVENGRTYLPLRFVSEKLGADVKWDGNTQTVSITK